MAAPSSPSPPPDVEAATPVPDKQPADNAAVHTPSDSLVGMSLSNAATPVLDKQTAANAAVHTSPDSVASVRLSKAATPVPDKQTATNAAVHTPSDSLVSVSLSESAGRASQIPSAVTSPTDIDGTLHRSSSLASNPAPGRVSQASSADASPADIVDEVLRRASSHTSNPLPSLDSDRVSSLVSNPASSLVSDRTSSLVSNRTLSLVSNLTPSHTSNPAPGLISNRVSSLASNRASSLASDQVSSPVSNAAPSPTVHDTIDSPGAEARLAQDVAHEMARSKSASLTASKTSSVRARSDSTGSDSSILVDWDTLDKSEQTEHTQDVDSDEQTTLLLARLEQENNAIATDPKSGNKTRSRAQSRPPSIQQLHKLVQEQGARSVRFSLLPAAAHMTELDFWAALVRDYPQTAQRLPTITANKIRSGVPAPLRGVVWVSMAGARDKAIEAQYDKLLCESSPYENIIGKDIGRSFPQHEMFRDPLGDGQKMLGRVLKCYSLYDTKIGYCQGLGFLVGPLLMNMGDKEAFCVLVRLMEDYDLRACFLPDLSGLHLRIYQFNRLLRQHVPKVASHLDALGIEGEYLSQWFLSFFAVTCPLPLLFRIYDIIFAEGASETIMRVALSIIHRNEKKILGYAEFEDVMQLLLSRQLWDVYGLNPASADDFVHDFVGFTSLVTRESLNALEANFREGQNGVGRQSFLPSVSSAASRFLGRLWTAGPKQQSLSPGMADSGRSSAILRTPSKQSLSTIASAEATSDSSASSASTALTDLTSGRESEGDFLRSVKSTEIGSMRSVSQASKAKEHDDQIEDLLTVLSEMQKNQAMLSAQLLKVQEERNEEAKAVRAFLDQIKQDISVPADSSAHRRAASEINVSLPQASHLALSPSTIESYQSLTQRLSSRHVRKSSNFETKADLRQTIVTVREQLQVEAKRTQGLVQQLDVKDQEAAGLRDELQKARARIKDAHFDKQRLEQTILDLRQTQRKKPMASSRSSSKVRMAFEEDVAEVRAAAEAQAASRASASGAGGLRELRLGARRFSRTNSTGAVPVFSKRSSSLAGHASAAASSAPASTAASDQPPDAAPAETDRSPSRLAPAHENDSLLLELAKAKTAEAVAQQELEELRARFEALRRQTLAGARRACGVSVSVAGADPTGKAAQPNGGTVAGGADDGRPASNVAGVVGMAAASSAPTPPAQSPDSLSGASDVFSRITSASFRASEVSPSTSGSAPGSAKASSGFGSFWGWGKR